jgi:hypothetical protein
VDEPLPASDAKRLILAILADGDVAFSKHAFDEMGKDRMTTQDVQNVLRGGAVQPGESQNGSWRYQVQTQRMCVVVAFRSETELVVVTAWRHKP